MTLACFHRVSTALLAFTLVAGASLTVVHGVLAATVTVNPGDNLNAKMLAAGDNDTVVVNAGTYAPVGASAFQIVKPLTVRANGNVVLQGSGAVDCTLLITSQAGYTPPNNTSVTGFTIQGAQGGVIVADLANLNGRVLSGITLRNLTVDTTSTPASPTGKNGIQLLGVRSSVLEGVTLVDAGQNGIYVGPNGSSASSDNLIMNCWVKATHVQHGIAIQSSDRNVLVGNTIGDPASGVPTIAFHGIILNRSGVGALGSRFNRIERNVIQKHLYDGITVTDASSFNFIGYNVLTSPSYHPSTRPTPSPTMGSGIWLNNKSNGNYLFGNDVSGSPESGLPVFASSDNYLHANRSHANFQAGVIFSDEIFVADPDALPPANTVFHNNYVYYNERNAMLVLRGATSADVAYNFFDGRSGFGGPLPPNNLTAGISVERSAGVGVYENFVSSVDTRLYVFSTSTGVKVFRNRFLDGSGNPSLNDGRRGLTYSIAPAGAAWDGGLGAGSGPGPGRVGGNHWSDLAAAGDPSPVVPYTAIYGGDGSSRDKFPFRSEHLGQAYAVSVSEPRAAQVIAQGAQKTIRWSAQGCALVDLSLQPANTLIAGNYPNVGYYIWSVPTSLSAGSGNTVRVDCKTSVGAATGVQGSSGSFTLGTADLVLLSPGRGFRADASGTLRVAWKRGPAFSGNVSVYLKVGGGAESLLTTTTNASYLDIPLPATASDQATIRVCSSTNATQQDAVDGSFSIRDTGTFGFTAVPAAASTATVGSIFPLRWLSPKSSYSVDLELLSGGSVAQTIARKLPDFGNYTWLVPEHWTPAASLRVTFRDAAGAVVGSSMSGGFKIFYTATAGVRVTRYRLYSPVTIEHLFTTNKNEYDILSSLSGIWVGEGPDHEIFNGPSSSGGYEAMPYYRIYDKIRRWHLWTTDRNEYMTLREYPAVYDAEGVDGYIFPAASAGAIAGTRRFDRLLHVATTSHHWTRDQNERSVLKSTGAWIDDALDGYVFCTNDSPRPCVASDVTAVVGDKRSLDPAGDSSPSASPSSDGGSPQGTAAGGARRGGDSTGFAVSGAGRRAVAGDLDGNGFPDLVVRHDDTGQLAVWYMEGATKIGEDRLDVGSLDARWDLVGFDDLDGNGTADLLWGDRTTGSLLLQRMAGARLAGELERETGAASAGWSAEAVGDLNGDGRADLLWRHRLSGQLYAWLIGRRDFGGARALLSERAEAGWEFRGLADFDGDATADLLWEHEKSGRLQLWLMDEGTLTARTRQELEAAPAGWAIATVRDFDGDGKADLLWHEAQSGGLAIWHLDGGVLAEVSAPVPDHLPVGWTIIR